MRHPQSSRAESARWVGIPWIIAASVCLTIVGLACLKSLSGPLEVDFTMFWGGRELAYLPPYRLLIEPLGLLPYGLAFCAWIAVTGALYLLAVGRKGGLAALANPAVAFNGMIGQNGFLTSAIMFAGLRALARSPWCGGAVLGLLIIKPHLALILPVVVIAARAWQAIPAALGTMALLLALSFLAFGAESFARSFEVGSNYAGFLEDGAWNWNELASFYALGRWLELEEAVAWLLHAAFTFGAMVCVWIAWRDDQDGKIPLTSAAALLISPYLFTYDAVLLTLALGWLRGPKAAVVWILLAVPLARVFVHHDWPNTVPLAAAVAVWAISFEARTSRSGAALAAAQPT